MGEFSANRWMQHEHALALAAAGIGSSPFARALDWLCAGDINGKLDFLEWHGLSSMCDDQVRRAGALDRLPEVIGSRLLASRRSATAQYLAQCGTWSQVAAALDQRKIEYVILKGVATREEVYSDPALRSAGDIDLLVRAADRQSVFELLAHLGFDTPGVAPSSAHETTYSTGRVDIDLHWDILRPGRTRKPLVDALIGRRVRGPRAWRLDDSDTVFLMLVHPAFTKYVCSRNMGLNRVVDLLRFVRAREVDWQRVAMLLADSGLCTAAWCTLRWIGMLNPGPDVVPDAFMQRVCPGPLRRAYLEQWLIRDWPGRLLGHADWLIQGAFTLPLHDRGADAWRALHYRAKPPAMAVGGLTA